MSAKINNILSELQRQLSFLEIEIDNVAQRSEEAINVIRAAIATVKAHVRKRGFTSQQEEIIFFKEIKPQFTSRLFYYNALLKIETQKPSGGIRVLKKYYNKELDRINRYCDANLDFFIYYMRGNTFLDDKYFVRGPVNIKLNVDDFYFERDETFSTSHDHKVGKIGANALLALYLENQLRLLDMKDECALSQRSNNAKLTWTAPKVAMTELVYALQTAGVFNNGNADLRDIVEYFSEIFNIELGQYRRTFLEIRVRKDERAKFISSLHEKLLKRMDDTDEAVY